MEMLGEWGLRKVECNEVAMENKNALHIAQARTGLRHEDQEILQKDFPLPGAEADHDGKDGGRNYAKAADHKVADAEERVLAAWVSEALGQNVRCGRKCMLDY